MSTLVFATRNPGKLAELEALLAPHGYQVLSLAALGECAEVEEDQPTFAGNAEKKARAALAAFGVPALADDSGLEVDALDGAPGVLSARFAGAGHDDAANNAKLIAELAGVPDPRRTARFRCALAHADLRGRLTITEGTLEGAIAHAPRGSGGFGYDPLFLVTDSGGHARTLAEYPAAEKNRVSHRARALAKMVALLASPR